MTKKIVAIGIGLFGYLILNIQFDISKADQYYFVNNSRESVAAKVTLATDLKERKSIWNDKNAEDESFLTESYMPVIIGFGIINILER